MTADATSKTKPRPRVAFPNTWLRLKRSGNTFTAYSSSDGETWTLYATKTLALPSTVFFGFALTAHTTAATATNAARVSSHRNRVTSFVTATAPHAHALARALVRARALAHLEAAAPPPPPAARRSACR